MTIGTSTFYTISRRFAIEIFCFFQDFFEFIVNFGRFLWIFTKFLKCKGVKPPLFIVTNPLSFCSIFSVCQRLGFGQFYTEKCWYSMIPCLFGQKLQRGFCLKTSLFEFDKKTCIFCLFCLFNFAPSSVYRQIIFSHTKCRRAVPRIKISEKEQKIRFPTKFFQIFRYILCLGSFQTAI